MKCNALIDVETKVALSGEALDAALKNPVSPRCGYELEPNDVFCPSCGAHCPSCGTHVELLLLTGNNKACGKRTTRVTFWASIAVFLILQVWIVSVKGVVVSDHVHVQIDGSLDLERRLLVHGLSIASFIAYGYFIVMTSVRRLHDIGQSGWLIVPSVCLTIASPPLYVFCVLNECLGFAKLVNWVVVIVNLVMIGWLGFTRGTKGPNKYGPDPLAYDIVFSNLEIEATKK